MFSSHWLLSKKGPLATLWFAAHCQKRLKKEQVEETNITASVDKILLEVVPVVTYRILGFLLLGVARIYSKKVGYLFHDCSKVLTNVQDLVGSKNASAHVEDLCVPSLSIILPKRFELDAFNLEVQVDINGGHQRHPDDIMLEGPWKNNGRGFCSDGQYHHEENATHTLPATETCFPIKELTSIRCMDDQTTVKPSSDDLSKLEVSMEKLCESSFILAECLEPLIFGESEEEQELQTFDEKNQTDGEQITVSGSEMSFVEQEEHMDLVKTCDNDQHMGTEEMKCSEVASCQTATEGHPISITVGLTPDSKIPNVSGATTPESLAIRTPSTKERAKVLRKRKRAFDETTVLPNKVLKQWIYNAGDLVCKRKKAPHSVLHAWKVHQMSNLHNIFQPLLPCTPVDLRSFRSQSISKTPEHVQFPEPMDRFGSPFIHIPLDEAAKPIQFPAPMDGPGSPSINRALEEAAIAPSTPVSHSASSRFHEARGTTKSDSDSDSNSVGPAFSKEEQIPSGENKFDTDSATEELNLCEGDSQGEDKRSARTRRVAKFLQKNFLKRKKQEAVNLSHLLEGKPRKDGAKVFYEILVLKTGGYVDVKQEKEYGDILVMETLKLDRMCESNT